MWWVGIFNTPLVSNLPTGEWGLQTWAGVLIVALNSYWPWTWD